MASRKTSRHNNLSGRDLKIFELHIRGMKNTEIADLMGVTTVTVSNCLNIEPIKEAREEVFQNTIARLSNGTVTESATTMARVYAPRAMQMQMQIAERSRSDAVRLKAITDILDRSLGKPTQRVVIDQMDNILDRMSESELETYHKDGTLPAWAEDLNAAGRESVLH